MKLLVLNYEYPPLGGGAGVVTANIAEGLARRGHIVTVVTTWFEGEPEADLKENLKIFRLKSKRKKIYKSNPVEMLSWMFACKKFLKKHLVLESYDLCFANFALPGGEVAHTVKNNFGIPYTILSHGHDIPWFFPEQMLWYHVFTYHWIRNICLQSAKNFLQSEEMKENIDAFLGRKHEKKNIVIYNGWDSKFFCPDYSKRNKTFTLIFPGRLVKQKDPMTFLKAVHLVSEKLPYFKVNILGDGALRKKMQSFVDRNNLQNIVSFKSWLTKEEMREQYQSGSLTVLPSLNEGMSIAMLEALACGQYVITTDVSKNKELIESGYNGEIVEKKNCRMLADTILAFYNEKFCNNYLIPINELEQYHKLYEWNHIVDKYEKELLEIVS